MLYLPKLILTIDGIIGCVKGGTWYQDVRHKIGDVEGTHTYQLLMLYTLCVAPLCCLVAWLALCSGPY